MFKSIRAKFLVTQIGFVLVVTVVLGLATYFIMFHSLRNNQMHYLEYVSATIGEKINLLIVGKKQLLEKVANSEMVTNYVRKQSENILVAHFGRFVPEFISLSYVDANGIKEVEAVHGQATGNFLNKAESVLIERLKQNPNKTLNTYVPFSSEIAGPCIEIGFLNRDFFDEFVGIILGKVSAVELSKSIQESRVGETGSVILLDSEGTILSCKDPNRILQKFVVDGVKSGKAVAGIKAGRSGFGRANILGVDSYFAYAPAYGRNWVVITVLPYSEFAAALNDLGYIILVVGFNILVLGAILSLLLAQHITEPISELVKGTSVIAKGDFSHRIRTASHDEIGTLARSFNRMAEDLGKTTTSVINLNREISQRRKVEASLRKSEKRFEEVAENSGDWIWEVNAEGLYTYSSPVVERILGYTPEELVGKKHFYDFFAPDTKEELKKTAFEAFARRESFKGFVNFNMHKNGSAVILETNGTPIVDDDGNLCGYRGADRDITERKRAEEKNMQTLSLLAATLESTADGILVVDLNGRVVSCNHKFQQLWRIPDKLIESNDDEKLLAFVLNQLRDPEGFLVGVRRLYADVEKESFDLLRFKDGRVFERFSQPQKIEDRIVGRVWSFRDVTERERAEESVRNLNEDLKSTVTLLTQSNRQLREFAHLAAHDLKTPLRGIATLAQWLVADYKEKFDDEGRQQVDLLIKRVSRMNELVDAILQYSTIARNTRNEYRVDLNSLLGTVLVEIKPPLGIKITIGKKLPVVVCEETLLQQVFYHLLANAVRFMDKPDGLITIDFTDREDVWVFSVSDNGPGIAPQHFERIFRLFQTLGDPDQSVGSGAGLTITRKIVELYGGRIWLTSELGHGSTFFFTLPKVPNVTANQEQVLAPASC